LSVPDTPATMVPDQNCKSGKALGESKIPLHTIYWGLNHLSTPFRDTTLNYHNFAEGVKQWTNVFGYSETPQSTQQNSPVSGWTRSIYGPNFQAISAANVDHNIPVQTDDVLKWFGL